MLFKRDASHRKRFRGYPPPDAATLRKFYKIFGEEGDGAAANGNDDDPNRDVATFETEIEDDEDAEEERERVRHLVSDLADLFVEASEGKVDRPAALRHLLINRRGNALVHRMRAAQKRQQQTTTKEKSMTDNRADQLMTIAKADSGARIFVIAERTQRSPRVIRRSSKASRRRRR